ncbi:unnamed protein product [Heterobilharzia americana]|nr:unnamed protein product [Heterobilharzia americana]CAH8557855.1 unnamed protein product [Heterobilharzia americana]
MAMSLSVVTMITEDYNNLTTPNATLHIEDMDKSLFIPNIVVPIVSVLLFISSVVITYLIDDPGIKTLKDSLPEDDLKSISESDKKHLRYLAERKLYVDTKGHTFSAFTPSLNTPETTKQTAYEYSENTGRERCRACSESHAPHVGEISSETQIILQHMLIRAGHPHNNTDSLFSGSSARSRSGFHNPFSSFKKSKATDSEAQKLEENMPKSEGELQC